MRWGGYNRHGEEAMKRALGMLLPGWTLYRLFLTAALGMQLIDNLKWRPGVR